MNLDLRPLTIAELLDRSIAIYRRHFVLCVGIMAIPSALLLVVMLPLDVYTHFTTVGPGDAADPLAQNVGALAAVMGGMAIGMIGYLVAYVLALGATSVAVAGLYRGVVPSIGESYRLVWPRAFDLVMLSLHISLRLVLVLAGLPFLGMALAGLLAMLVGPFAFLFIVVSFAAGFALWILLALRYSLSVPVLLLENLRPRPALVRSTRLARGNMGRAFLVIFTATVITYAAMLLFQGPFLVGSVLAGTQGTLPLFLSLAGTVFGTLGTTLVAPVMIVGLVVLYLDARVRTEALDVQVMLDRVARADAQAAPAGLSPASTPQ